MRIFLGVLFFTMITNLGFSQIKIHSHNDYVQKRPFLEAYENKADQIEVDIFLLNDSLIVSHSRKEINAANTLNKLYLMPISTLFKQYLNKVSNDKKYTFTLMIDIKDDWNKVYPALQKEIGKYNEIFDRSKNKHSIQIVISGNRPLYSTFHTYPKWLFFDGLPDISYAKEDLARVTMISDNFAKYSKWNGFGPISNEDKAKLIAVVARAKELKKAMRFWGAPDTEDSWNFQLSIGASILNTDKVKESKNFLKEQIIK